MISNNVNKLEVLWRLGTSLFRSLSLLRWLGYGLLLLSVLDLINVFVPSNFMNPEWEFQMFGTLVEQAAVPLIGVVLVFLGEREGRYRWERELLKCLSWSTLLVSFLFVLLLPLGVVNTIRLDQFNQQQIAARINQGVSQVKTLQRQLDTVTTIEQMELLLSRLDDAGNSPEITGKEEFEAVREQMASFLEEGEDSLNTQAKAARSSQQLALLKNSVKWHLGALISSVLFFGIWRGTFWARRK